jgi:ring-1,2-phenylacetyl-CoA epoxidase subunit PaaC
MAEPEPLVEYLLRLGDNCLILGHRLSEWCGHGPALEEDLALANVALDLIGQAKLWLGLAGEVDGKGRDADKLAFLRDAREFRNALLVEQKNGDFAVTMGRQLLFDTWHYLLLRELHRSTDTRIAEIADKAIKEVAYHLERSRDWVVRLGDGTEESHGRAQEALDSLWRYAAELFAPDPMEQQAAAAGIGPQWSSLEPAWRARVEPVLEEATLRIPQPTGFRSTGKAGVHTEHLGHLLAEMQWMQRAYPGMKW